MVQLVILFIIVVAFHPTCVFVGGGSILHQNAADSRIRHRTNAAGADGDELKQGEGNRMHASSPKGTTSSTTASSAGPRAMTAMSSSSVDVTMKTMLLASAVGASSTIPDTTATTKSPKLTLSKTLVRAGKKAFRGGITGFIAGAIQVLTLMWLRTANNYQYRYGVPMTIALRDLYRQGGLSRFYRGWPYALIQGPLARFGAVAANDASVVLAAYYLGRSERAAKGAFATALGSVLAGMWRLFLMPLDTCKTVQQVDGARGFQHLIEKVVKGDLMVLYSGALATILATIIGHYPWFFMHNLLDGLLAVPSSTPGLLFRSAFIGFFSSALSDTVSNSVRVVKTVKQAAAGEVGGGVMSYESIIRTVLAEGGLKSLFGRGLMTRILANGIQSMLFTVIWKWLSLTQKHIRRPVVDPSTGTTAAWAGTAANLRGVDNNRPVT